MTCFTIKDAIKHNDVEKLERYLKDNKGKPLEFCYEDMIITGHKKELLQLLIKYNCISQDGLALSGVFDDDNKLYYKIENMIE